MATEAVAYDTPPPLHEYSSHVHKNIEAALAKLTTTITVARPKEPPDQQPVVTPQRGWSLPPSVTNAPLGIKPWAAPHLHLEPPRFDGENAPEWICNIQEYYNHHCTPLDDRLYLTQYLFDHPASDWREYWKENNRGKGWDDFLLAVKQRFDPDLYDDDYVHRLASLRQTSTVEAYQTSFEALLPHALHVGESMLSYLFIMGLKSPQKQVVLMRQPSTLRETFAIALKLQAYHAGTASPGPFTRTERTCQDQRQPNCESPYTVANREPDHQPSERKTEVTQVTVINQFGVQPVNADFSNDFANGSGSNSIVCDGSMGKYTIYVDIVTKEHNGCNMDCISVDVNPIDDSFLDQACSKALNIDNGVIATDDIEEQSAKVQALVETHFCTDFLDSVNPQTSIEQIGPVSSTNFICSVL